MTVRHHLRSAVAFGVPIFAHRAGLHELENEDVQVQAYEAGDELAAGVRVLAFGRICPDASALHIAVGPGALAFGDGIVNCGGLGHPPDRFLGAGPDAVKADIVGGLVPLLDEDFDVLLFAHERRSQAAARQCCASSSRRGGSSQVARVGAATPCSSL